MSNDLNAYCEEMTNLFRLIAKNFRKYMMDQIAEHDFTVPQMMLMQELYHHPRITLKELSNLLGLAKSTVCGIVDRLEIQNVVVRTRDPDDRRAVRISLAPGMMEYKESMNAIKTNYLTRLLQNLDSAETEQILSSLRKLNSLMENRK